MIQLNSPSTIVGISLLGLYILTHALKLLRHSSLNSVKDAHWSVKFCGLWIWWHRVQEQDAVAVHEAHVRLGPVIRLGPREISVNDVDGGLKPIYEGRLPKTEFYLVASSYGRQPLVAIKGEEPHRHQKRLVAKPYGTSYLKGNNEWRAQQDRLAGDLVSGLDELIKTNADVELYDVFFAWSIAATSTYIFGRVGGLNLLRDIPEARRVREEYSAQRAYQFVGAFLHIPSKIFHWLGYHPELRWVKEMQDRADSAYNSASKAAESEGWMPVYNFMGQSCVNARKAEHETNGTRLSAQDTAIVSAEMQDHIIAGVDTSGVVLMVCAWQLSMKHNRHWQDRLREEARTGQTRDLEQLPILNAIIKESLRLYPPVPAGLPRVTNKPTVLGPEGYELTIPAGIKVHVQAQSLHHNSIFENAESFRPERWLNSPSDKKAEMERWFWAFGSGTRRCLGEYLGLSNIRVALVALWTNFETQVTETTNLKMTEGIVAAPLPINGDFLRLRVRKVGA